MRCGIAILLTTSTAFAQPGLAPIIDHESIPEPPPITQVTPPPIDWGYLFGSTLLGSLLGGIAGGGGAVLGFSLANCDFECDEAFLGGIVLGGLGLVAGSSWVAYKLGARNGVDGSIAATIGGSVVGLVAGLAIADRSHDEDAALLGVVVLPALGATLGFTLTREWKPTAQRVAMPRLSNDATVIPLAGGSF
jgi:hypothetical protein